jgi:predicted DNA-binding transcriptional regulator AlpA
MSIDMNTKYYDETEVSEMIGPSLPTLRRWRLEDRGPKFRKFGSLVRYGNFDLDEWVEAQPSGGFKVSLKIIASSAHVSRAPVRRKV